MIILFPLSYRLEYSDMLHDQDLFDQLYNEYKNDSNNSLWVRPHPADKFDFKKHYPQIKLSENPLVMDLKNCDVVVCTLTSVIIDAIRCLRFVFVVRVKNWEGTNFEKIMYEAEDAGLIKITTPEYLFSDIRNYKSISPNLIKWKKFLLKYSAPFNSDVIKSTLFNECSHDKQYLFFNDEINKTECQKCGIKIK